MQALEVNMPSCVCSCCLFHDERDVKTSFIIRTVGRSKNLGGGATSIIQAPLKKKVLPLFQSNHAGVFLRSPCPPGSDGP